MPPRVVFWASLIVLPIVSACGGEDGGGSGDVVPHGAAGSGGATAGSGGATAGSGGATAGSGGATAGSGGATAGSGGATAGSGGTTAGSGGATAGSGGATAGSGGATAGSGGATAGSGGAGAGGAAAGNSGGGGAAGGMSGPDARAAIEALATGSTCAKYLWKDRGKAPKGYPKGVALVFARAVCEPSRSDVVVVSQANTGKDLTDALSWYKSVFDGLGMPNEKAGIDTLRHAYTLLIGLGMRESSGQHCVGRDASASNTDANSAEAGAWQTSYDSKGFSPELPKLFSAYQADASGCFLDVFSQGVTCSAADWKNWGTGTGVTFQKLEKECPAFAAEYAAVMLRVSGGSKGHYGPLRTKAAEVRPECDEMLKGVQGLVIENPQVCNTL